MIDLSFYQWFTETEKTAGSLVIPSHAAKMLGVSRQYMEKIVISGRIKKHYFEDVSFVGMHDINKEMARRFENSRKGFEK